MNVILGKKQLVAAGLTVLLGTAVAVNFIYSGGKDKKLTEPAAEVSGRPVRPMGKARMGKPQTARRTSRRQGSTNRAAARKQPRCSRACIRAAT